MRAGTLRHRVQIQESTAGTWKRLAAAWAAISPASEADLYSEEAKQGKVSHRIRVRYRSDIQPKHRVVYGDRRFLIQEARSADDRNVGLDLLCQEIIGWQATFYTYTSETYDPTTGATTQSGETQVVVDVLPPKEYASGFDAGAILTSGEIEVTVQAGAISFTPSLGQRVDFDGVAFRVTEVGKNLRGGELASYTLKLER